MEARISLLRWSALAAGALFLADGFQLGECVEIFRTAGGAFDLYQSGQSQAPARHAEQIELNGMRKQILVPTPS